MEILSPTILTPGSGAPVQENWLQHNNNNNNSNNWMIIRERIISTYAEKKGGADSQTGHILRTSNRERTEGTERTTK